MRFPRGFLPWLALPALALICALVSNAFASPARHLRWIGAPPPLPTVPPPVLAAPAPARAVSSEVPRPLPAPAAGSKSMVQSQAVAAPVADFAPDPAHPVREIAAKEAWEAFQRGAPFLDARRSAAFAEGHVAGAWCAPLWESDLDTRLTVFEATAHPRSAEPLILYCDGGDCRDSHLLAAKLMELGYRNLLVYRGGYPEWASLGRPVEKGARP